MLQVHELIDGVRDLIEAAYEDVWVEGELSNFKQAASGHCYFTLKDAEAQIRGVMWRHFTQYVFFEPRDGLLVRVHGQATVYGRRGDLQLVTRSMQLAGEGALQKAFEERKRQLEAEGLFDARHKQALPSFPETIGIVTSGDGAALHDILTVLERRFPQVHVLVCPVRVQGMGAADTIAEAIEAFNAVPRGDALRADVLIVGRGGGSQEDLWAFNEEVVARALFASEIPTISAVGHETDVSVADFVADVRAATPTMAAELAVPDRREVAAYVQSLYAALHDDVTLRLDGHRRRIRHLTDSYAFHRPLEQLRQQRQRLEELQRRLHRQARQHVAEARRQTEALRQHLRLLNPVRPLQRGYARVEQDGRLVDRADALHPGDVVILRFHDGRRTAEVRDETRGGAPDRSS